MNVSSITTISAAVTSMLLAVFGVSYYALLWGGVGALFGLVLTKPEGRWIALFTVILSALVGAAMGDGLAELAGGGRKAVVALSAICGAGAKTVVSAAIDAMVSRLRLAGGGQTGSGPR